MKNTPKGVFLKQVKNKNMQNKKNIVVSFLIIALFFTGFNTSVNENAKISQEQLVFAEEEEPNPYILNVTITAYSSTPDQTDDTPFITANGGKVRDGIIAANFLPFGSKVQIPEHFGDKVFEVTDRMHQRKVNYIDVWMPTRQDALNFGIDETEIVVLEVPDRSTLVLLR
ncbi:MAG: hypothetical protein WDZ80_02665 [Candidatus Paceibacterota bacterium]